MGKRSGRAGLVVALLHPTHLGLGRRAALGASRLLGRRRRRLAAALLRRLLFDASRLTHSPQSVKVNLTVGGVELG
jgi:hypothetical protein